MGGLKNYPLFLSPSIVCNKKRIIFAIVERLKDILNMEQIKAKVNRVEQTINFDTTKLFRMVEQYVCDYDYDFDSVERKEPIECVEALGVNTSLTIIPSYVRTRRGFGCDMLLVDFDVEIYLYNPLTDNEIIIETSVDDVELESIYDYYSYYGVRQSDFL